MSVGSGHKSNVALPSICFWVTVVLVTIGCCATASAQKFGVVYTFSGGSDGANPFSPITVNRAGILFGTTFLDGAGYGTVFQITPQGPGYAFTTLYQFKGGDDGAGPYHQGVTIGPDGSLYGTTAAGGGTSNICSGFQGTYNGCGIVYNLKPQISFCRTLFCPWNETVLYRFQGHDDGAGPFGNVIFDPSGNMYGVTFAGGTGNVGTVFELTRSMNTWTKKTIWNFNGIPDGQSPADGLVIDVFGNLYGTTTYGGALGFGCVFMLQPSGSIWKESILYSFHDADDGANPYSALVFDPYGNLYGTTVSGSVFRLTPGVLGWSFTSLHEFGGFFNGGPHGPVAIDPAGNIYGTTLNDDRNTAGTIWGLAPSPSGWVYSDLYLFDFDQNGAEPANGLTWGPDTVLYGTTSSGGSRQGACQLGCGVVFRYAPFGTHDGSPVH